MPIIEIDQEKYHVSDDQDFLTHDEILKLAERVDPDRWDVWWEPSGRRRSLSMKVIQGTSVPVIDDMVIYTAPRFINGS